MGLDVYLYRCPNRPAARQIEDAYEKRTTELWAKHCGKEGEWGSLAKDEQDRRYEVYKAARIAVARELGLTEDGHHPQVEEVKLPSARWPDHYFKIGYFRSSYNDTGINSVLRSFGLPTLSDIFNPGDEYEFVPNWEAARQNASRVLAGLRSQATLGIRVLEVRPNMLRRTHELPASAEAARQIIANERKHNDGCWYSNIHGDFFPDRLPVVALIPGQYCVFAAYKLDDNMDFYTQALEIVIETCDYVLAQPDHPDYYLHWSS